MTRAQSRLITDPAQLGVDDLLDSYNAWHEEFFHEEPVMETAQGPLPYWRCSSLGKCMRQQVLARARVPKTKEPDELAYRRFAAGDTFHWFTRKVIARMGLLIAEEVAITAPELSLAGHIDAIIGGEVQPVTDEFRGARNPRWVEFIDWLRPRVDAQFGKLPITGIELKSMNSWSLRQVADEGRLDQQVQLAGYKILTGRHPDLVPAIPDQWEAVLMGRDSVAVRRIPLAQRFIDEAWGRIQILNEAWTTGNWPPCTCGQTEGLEWEQKYCSFLDPDDPSACCGTSLLDRLEASLQ